MSVVLRCMSGSALVLLLLSLITIWVRSKPEVASGTFMERASTSVVKLVNPRFELFQSLSYAALLGVGVILFTAVVVVYLTVVLRGQCTLVCSLVPFPSVDVDDTSACTALDL